MSGESPWEANIAVWNGKARSLRPYQTKDAGDTVTATVARQTSRQQLAVCKPLGQHDLEVSGLAADVVQSDTIAEAANATNDPCRPRARITIKAMSWRFMSER
jgi:hypothetical protein